MILVVLMLLPVFASYVFAVSPDDVVVTDEPQNIAGVGTIQTPSQYGWDSWKPEYLLDGDKETGTYSPRGASTNFTLDLEKEFYISEIVFVFNGKGELPYEEETVDSETNDTKSFQIITYDKNGVETYNSGIIDANGLLEFTAEVKDDVQTVYVKELPVDGDYCTLWELEVYAVEAPPRCNAEGTNIASQALLNSTYYDGSKKENLPSSWWAMDLTKMIDGDVNTGTQTVKAANFSLWMYFGQEHYFSDVVVHCNGRGYLSSGDITEDFIDPETKKPAVDENDELTGPIVYKSYLLTVVMYDFNDEVVFESEVADVSGLTEFKVNADVEAATIELRVSNAGNDGYSGAIYFWDVEANEGMGSHLYKQIDQENPACGVDGYRLYECQDEKCGGRKTVVLPATGYHVWDDGEVTLEPTAEANGIKTHTCTICNNKIDRDVPATGHNWTVDKVVEPYCEVGYTVYKCSDESCSLTYIGDYTTDIPLGHKYDDGVVTKKATVAETGEMVFTCQREDCGHTKIKVLREAKYIDNTFKLDSSAIVDFIASDNEELATNIFDGNKSDTYWCAPGVFTEGNGVQTRNSGTLEIILDKEYYFTKGTIHVASNWNWMEVHFMYEEDGEWKTSATYSHDRIQADDITGVDMTGTMNFGARASKIVIEAVGSIGGTDHSVKTHWLIPEYKGSGLRFYEIELEAHKCEFTPEDYEDESKWVKPTCNSNGSCKAKCVVCDQETTIVLDSLTYGHNYGEVEVLEEPSCAEVGVGTKQCTVCKYKTEVDVPATGEHKFDTDFEHIAPTCSQDGVGQIVCKYCGTPDYNYPIPATGEHIYDYIVKSLPNYTAVGKTIHACIYCEKQGEGADKIEEKLEIPENFVTFTGYSIRMTDYVGIRASFKFDQEILETLEQTCDVTITIKAKNLTTGKTVSAQAYGKQVHYSGEEKFNENNEFSAVARVANCSSEFAFSYEVKLVNFRGTEIKEYDVPVLVSGKSGVTAKDVASNILANSKDIKENTKKFLEELIAE